MSVSIEVGCDIELICEYCGNDLEANQNSYNRSSNFGKIGVEPCSCQTNEINALKQEIEDLNNK